MPMEPVARLTRLEQQLAAFERLHADELRDLARRLAACVQVQEDELKLLREELADIRADLAAGQSAGAATAPNQAGDAVPLEPTTPGGFGEGQATSSSATGAAPPTERSALPPSHAPQAVSRRELFGRQRP